MQAWEWNPNFEDYFGFERSDNLKRGRDDSDEFDQPENDACEYQDILAVANDCAKRFRFDEGFLQENPQLSLQDFLNEKDVPPIEFNIYGENEMQDEQSSSDSICEDEEDDSDDGDDSGDDECSDDQNEGSAVNEEGAATECFECAHDLQASELEISQPGDEQADAAQTAHDEPVIYEGGLIDFGAESCLLDIPADEPEIALFFQPNDCEDGLVQPAPVSTVAEAQPIPKLPHSVLSEPVLAWARKWATELGIGEDNMKSRVLRILSIPAAFPINFKDLPYEFQRVFSKFHIRISTAITALSPDHGILRPGFVFVTFTSNQKDHYVCSTVDWLRIVAQNAFPSKNADSSMVINTQTYLKIILPQVAAMQGNEPAYTHDAIVRGVSEVVRSNRVCSFVVHWAEKAADSINEVIENCFVPIYLRAEHEGNTVHIFLGEDADFEVEMTKLQLACYIHNHFNFLCQRRLKKYLAYSDINNFECLDNRRNEKIAVQTDAVRIVRQISDWCVTSKFKPAGAKDLFAIAHVFLFSTFSLKIAPARCSSEKINKFVSNLLVTQDLSTWGEIVCEFVGRKKISYSKIGTHLNSSGKMSLHVVNPLKRFDYLRGANQTICDRCANNVCPHQETYYGPVRSLGEIEFETDVRFGAHFAYFFY